MGMFVQNSHSRSDLKGYCNPSFNYLSFEESTEREEKKSVKESWLGSFGWVDLAGVSGVL
jgi:hypothetical protein